MKQIIKLFTLLSLASLVLLAACGPTPPETEETEEITDEETGKTAVEPMDTEPPSLDDTAWQLDSYAVDGEMVETLPDANFAFVDGQMAGTTGCNNTSAGYTTDGNAITFEMGMSTMMFCGEAENGQEDAVQANIAAVVSYEIDGDSMEMMDADGNVILQFSAIDMTDGAEVDNNETSHEAILPEGSSLEGTMWQLDSYVVDGAMVETMPSAQFGFADGQMAGTTGCNNTGAGYITDGNAISFEMGMSTMMSCGPELDAQEQAIQANIAIAASYYIDGDTMEMMDADGNVILQFSVMESTSLTDTLWQATGINNGTGGVTSVLAETTVTAVFGTDGSLSGNASCNMYNTSYEAGDGDMSINPSIVTTRRACTEPITIQEGQYLTALANVVTYTIVGDKLELRDADGSLQISYIAAPAPPLVGTTWEAVSYSSGGQVMVGVMSGSRITAVFNEDDTFNGNAGCNSYFGSYERSGNDGLTIGETAATAMACADNDMMVQEAAYLAALRTVATYTISNNKLELRTADGAIAVSYTAAEVVSLADSAWDVTAYNNGKAAVRNVIINTELTMNFDADGGVNGSAGCNNYFGSYESGSELLTFGPMGATQMLCAEPEGVMEQEAEFLAALATVNSYHIDGDHMTMRDENGSTAVQLQVVGE